MDWPEKMAIFQKVTRTMHDPGVLGSSLKNALIGQNFAVDRLVMKKKICGLRPNFCGAERNGGRGVT